MTDRSQMQWALPQENIRRQSSITARKVDWLQASINAHPVGAFIALSALYFAVVLATSSLKLLWLDELITVHLAQLPSAAAIWNALARGADPNPPMMHLLVHFSRMVFGDVEFAYRLPAFIGYWIGLLSLFLYLRRRVPGIWAITGTLLSMTMGAFDYSFESRSYALMYGFAMLAFLCWSVTADRKGSPRIRLLAYFGMIFALAAGISTNYFAVLAFFPIAAGEIVLTLRRIFRGPHQAFPRQQTRAGLLRALDLRIWFGLALAGSTLLVYRSMIEHSIAQFAPHAWNKVSIDQVFDSYTEMVEIVLYPILALFAFGILLYVLARLIVPLCLSCRKRLASNWFGALLLRAHGALPIPAHEAAGVFFLMAYPILGYLVASIHGGMLSPRFVIPVCFGFAVAATLLLVKVFGTMPRAGAVTLCFVLAWFISRESYVGYAYAEQRQSFYKVLDHLPQAEAQLAPTAPIVIPDPLMALTFQHYAPPALAARVVFPVDFPAVRKYRGDDSPDENLWAGRNLIYNLPIVPLATFQRAAGNYLILASDGNWLVQDLRHHDYRVHRLPIDTRAEAIGGFTPLNHGTPVFYTAAGDASPNPYASCPTPTPLQVANNLPSAQSVSANFEDDE
jgi:hypothetical protein